MTSDEFLKECKEIVHKNTEKAKGQSISLSTFLFGIFLTLKLCGVIAWSWWWVFAPLWIPFAFLFLVFVIVVIFAFILFLRNGEYKNNHTSDDEEISA